MGTRPARSATVPVQGTEGCSILATLEIIGDFWSMAVLRCVALGIRRFGHIQTELGVATNVLSDRLARLVDAGILDRVLYQDRPPRHEYVLTTHGMELVPIVIALKSWGDRHLQERGPWSRIRHQGCAQAVEVAVVCPDCGNAPSLAELETVVLRTS